MVNDRQTDPSPRRGPISAGATNCGWARRCARGGAAAAFALLLMSACALIPGSRSAWAQENADGQTAEEYVEPEEAELIPEEPEHLPEEYVEEEPAQPVTAPPAPPARPQPIRPTRVQPTRVL